MANLLQQQLAETQVALEEELTLATQVILEKSKALQGSKLVESIEWEYQKDSFVMLALDYYVYVSEGRKALARKVPIQDLIQWIKRKNIPSPRGVNATAWAIQQSIYKQGIIGKKFGDPVLEVTSELTAETMAEDLSNYIVDDLVLILEQNN
jgi:hypothetical protein